MTAQLITQYSGAPLSQTALAAALTAAGIAAGFTLYDSYTVSSTTAGYGSGLGSSGSIGASAICLKLQYNAASKATVYLNICCYLNGNNTQFSWAIYDGWNATAHTGTNGSGYQLIAATTLSALFPITFWIVNGAELKGFYIQQWGCTYSNSFIGVYRPSIQPSWWVSNSYDNSYLYCFVPYSVPYWNPISSYWAWCNYSGNQPWGVAPANNSTASPLFQIAGSGGICPIQYPNVNNNYELDIQITLNLGVPTGGNCSGLAGEGTELWLGPGYNGIGSYTSYSLQQGSTVTYTSGGTTSSGIVLMCANPTNTAPYSAIIRTQ